MDRVSFILSRAKGKILDVGFVACTLHERIKEKFQKKDIYGVDIESVPDNPNYKQGTAEKIPFEDDFFDTAVAGELVEHLEEPELFFREMNRVLKSGGQLIVTTPNRESLINRITHQYHTKIHLSLLTKKELLALFERNDFEVKEYFCLPYNQESSPGSSQKWFYPVRNSLHHIVPQSLQEEQVVRAEKR